MWPRDRKKKDGFPPAIPSCVDIPFFRDRLGFWRRWVRSSGPNRDASGESGSGGTSGTSGSLLGSVGPCDMGNRNVWIPRGLAGGVQNAGRSHESQVHFSPRVLPMLVDARCVFLTFDEMDALPQAQGSDTVATTNVTTAIASIAQRSKNGLGLPLRVNSGQILGGRAGTSKTQMPSETNASRSNQGVETARQSRLRLMYDFPSASLGCLWSLGGLHRSLTKDQVLALRSLLFSTIGILWFFYGLLNSLSLIFSLFFFWASRTLFVRTCPLEMFLSPSQIPSQSW